MIRPIKLRRKRIIIDIDTQRDLFLASGAECIRNHRRVLMNIRRALAWARAKKIRSISTCLCKKQKNSNCCVEGTEGQKKLQFTLRNKRTEFAISSGTDIKRNILIDNDQIIFNKRTENPFEEPRAERLLTELRADEIIVLGGIAEKSVVTTVLGLLQRGKRVTVLIDAIGTYNRQQADIAFRKMKAKGANIIETRAYAGMTHLKSTGVCDCKICKIEEKAQQKAVIGA